VGRLYSFLAHVHHVQSRRSPDIRKQAVALLTDT
jgi:hypothetical protein